MQRLDTHEIVIRVQVWVAGRAMRQFERHFRQRLKEGLYASGIEMPNPNFDVAEGLTGRVSGNELELADTGKPERPPVWGPNL